MAFARRAVLFSVVVLLSAFSARAGDVARADIDAMKKEIEDLRKQVSSMAPVRPSAVERSLDNRYGPNTTATSKSGKLTIGGLIHVWYTSYQKDNRGLFDKAGPATLADTNEGQDTSSFRIRRSELMFTMDIHENITAVVLIDPTGEIGSFPLVTDNQGLHKTANNVSPEFNGANGPGLGSTGSIGGIQKGAGSAPLLLEDAFINYHGVIPHHDFTVGQFKPQIGEESIRSSSQLDFVERSFAALNNDLWDLGANVHGTWWDDRFQYTFAVMDGAGNYHGSAGQTYNRADDNNDKDFSWRLMVRPVWKSEKWGSLELGASEKFGRHGASGGPDPVNAPVNGLNRRKTWASFYDAWASYRPGWKLKGWWLRGEYAWIKDRDAPGQVADDSGNGTTDLGNTGSGSGLGQGNGKPYVTQGWTFSTGYKMSDSIFFTDCDCSSTWLKNFEFTFRYDVFQNVAIADLADPSGTDAYRTAVYTGGINYYIKGQNAKLQLNYNAQRNPDGGAHNFHNVRNNSFVMNFQVAF